MLWLIMNDGGSEPNSGVILRRKHFRSSAHPLQIYCKQPKATSRAIYGEPAPRSLHDQPNTFKSQSRDSINMTEPVHLFQYCDIQIS